MPKDSQLWEQAYISYKKYLPKSKYNQKVKKKVKKTSLDKEPMVLLEEYRDILKQISELSKKRNKIKQELKRYKVDPVKYTRSDYFTRPILLYVLKLEHGCWYVGMSRNVDRRYKAHLKGKTMWTKEHPPTEIFEVRETGLNSDSEASRLEDELTLEYAKKYGIEYVRGGGYCQRKPIWPKDILEPDMSWIKI